MYLKTLLQKSYFVLSSPDINGLPLDKGIEVALIGRSNAGKSSALNALTQQKKLAKISKTPGRTQLINVFQVTDSIKLIDLPGYGFAKVPLKIKEKWQVTINNYLIKRKCLNGIVVLMDIRLPLRDMDVAMLKWAADCELNILVLLTKCDKLKRGATQNTKFAVMKSVREISDKIKVVVFSSHKHIGVDEAISVLTGWFGLNNDSTD